MKVPTDSTEVVIMLNTQCTDSSHTYRLYPLNYCLLPSILAKLYFCYTSGPSHEIPHIKFGWCRQLAATKRIYSTV